MLNSMQNPSASDVVIVKPAVIQLYSQKYGNLSRLSDTYSRDNKNRWGQVYKRREKGDVAL